MILSRVFLTTRLKKTVCVAVLASLSLSWASAQTAAAPRWNDPIKFIARVDWVDPLNPSYVNVGDDRFLFDTKEGVKLWDFATRTFQEPRLAAAAGDPRIEHLGFSLQMWARLGGPAGPVGLEGIGNATPGTVFIGVNRDSRSGHLLWWNPATQLIATSLPLANETGSQRLLQIDANNVLVCHYGEGASVAQLVGHGADVALKWAAEGDSRVRASLVAAGIVGTVTGFGSLSLTDGNAMRRPVYYDTSLCNWELADPPSDLAPYLNKETRTRNPFIKPYFLSGGRVLVPEIDYFDASRGYSSQIQSALLWDPASRRWTRLPSNRGWGNVQHSVGQDESVFATGFESDVIEFFDVSTLTWRRSIESIPDSEYVSVEPLHSGQALVMLRPTFAPHEGMLGVMTPSSGNAPAGKLLDARNSFYGEVVLPGGRMMLLGAGNSWYPTDAVELVDMAKGQATALSPFPAGQPVPVAPSGLPLQDGSVLVFAGLAPRCSPGRYYFGDGACADRNGLPSMRYWFEDNHWETLPQLKIPFSWGPHWQTGNSELVSQWPRADITVRPNGDVVWLESADFLQTKDREDWPRVSWLKTWSPAHPEQAARDVAKLRKARSSGTLITLNDGRLIAVGGDAQLERVALEKDCLDCPDEFVSIGPFQPARSTEVLDDSNPAAPAWRPGPFANFGGGKAFKLANGRIFKLSLVNRSDENGYQAEVADRRFTAWTKLPPMPKVKLPKIKGNELRRAHVNNVGVIGNRVLMLTDKDMTIAWDDDRQAWLVWKDWPARAGKDTPLSVTASPNPGRAFVRYRESFATLPMPRK